MKRYGTKPPVDKIKNEAALDDSILAAQMLQSAVHQVHVQLRHRVQTLHQRPSKKSALPCEIAWIADTGSAQERVCRNMVHPSSIYDSDCPLDLTTANGASHQAEVHVSCLNRHQSVWSSGHASSRLRRDEMLVGRMGLRVEGIQSTLFQEK